MTHTRLAAAISMAAFAAAGLGVGVGVAACGATGQVPAAAGSPGSSGYSYYRAMMGRLYSAARPSGMMGSTASQGWMMSETGYRWMMGGPDAPAWMRGSALPGYMMGTSRDSGKIMGALFADAPGTRISPAQVARLGRQIPAGATVSRAQHSITFSGTTVRLVVLASPAGDPDETFRMAGMVNPAVVVKVDARVSIEVINADPDTAQGLVITASGIRSAQMPMLTASPAFAGSAVWFLGNPTSAGMHAATLSFTARTPGTYRYLSPVPGHAQQGMTGTFTVSGN
jgi:rusticyanin